MKGHAPPSRLLACATGALGVVFVSACAAVFLQTDGFDEKLKQGCKTEDQCKQLQLEAQQRIIKCRDNTVGYIRCSDARADKLAADSYVKKWDDKRAEERQARQDEVQREIDNQRRQREEERHLADRNRKAQIQAAHEQDLSRQIKARRDVIATCDATKEARTVRNRHLQLKQTAGALVRQNCRPRNGTESVQVQCKDENGFVRTCSKQVPAGVVGYSCPKDTDPEVVKIGLFELGLSDSWPFPEDESIRVRDDDCDRAADSLKLLEAQLQENASLTTDANQ